MLPQPKNNTITLEISTEPTIYDKTDYYQWRVIYHNCNEPFCVLTGYSESIEKASQDVVEGYLFVMGKKFKEESKKVTRKINKNKETIKKEQELPSQYLPEYFDTSIGPNDYPYNLGPTGVNTGDYIRDGVIITCTNDGSHTTQMEINPELVKREYETIFKSDYNNIFEIWDLGKNQWDKYISFITYNPTTKAQDFNKITYIRYVDELFHTAQFKPMNFSELTKYFQDNLHIGKEDYNPNIIWFVDDTNTFIRGDYYCAIKTSCNYWLIKEFFLDMDNDGNIFYNETTTHKEAWEREHKVRMHKVFSNREIMETFIKENSFGYWDIHGYRITFPKFKKENN